MAGAGERRVAPSCAALQATPFLGRPKYIPAAAAPLLL